MGTAIVQYRKNRRKKWIKGVFFNDERKHKVLTYTMTSMLLNINTKIKPCIFYHNHCNERYEKLSLYLCGTCCWYIVICFACCQSGEILDEETRTFSLFSFAVEVNSCAIIDSMEVE